MQQPTIVYFHVTVLSIDTINEESMVETHFINFINLKIEVYIIVRYRLQ